MAAPTLLPNLIAGNNGAVDLATQNIGVKPVGNGGGSQLPGPSGINGKSPSGAPLQTIMPSANPSANPPILPIGVTGISHPPALSGAATPLDSGGGSPTLLPTNGANPTTAYPDPTTISPAPSLTGVNEPKLTKQLNSEYGTGVGSLILSEINSLGSGDDAYMQAYEKSMAQPNAEAMATLSTQLGNEGISGDSSTSAIAKADLLSGEVADEGRQEQQLKMNDLAELLGMTPELMPNAAKDAADTGWSEFGKVIGDIGGTIASMF